MGTVQRTFNTFIYRYEKFKAKECTKDYARQMVGFHKTAWYKLCRDYDNGKDVSRYFSKEEHNIERHYNYY